MPNAATKDKCRVIGGPSLPAQLRDEGACFEELLFKIRRIGRKAAITREGIPQGQGRRLFLVWK
jgi:hypothetical protein